MPLSNLSPLITIRFQEVGALLSVISNLESPDPRVPDTDDVRALRGLLYVHMYAAFEYAMDQSFIRLAQYVSSMKVERKHIQTPIFSVGLDAEFNSLQSMNAPVKKFRKRIETVNCIRDKGTFTIPDNVLSPSLQSAGSAMIALAFEVYGVSKPYLYDQAAKGYIDEVVERRHAVAHGRESPIDVGVRKVTELRKRHETLYKQSIYVVDTLSEFCGSKSYVLPRHRRVYPS